MTHYFCSSFRFNMHPTPLHHSSIQERDTWDENEWIGLLRSESPFVFYHCQFGVSPVVVVGRNSFLVSVQPCKRFVLRSNAIFTCVYHQADTANLERTISVVLKMIKSKQGVPTLQMIRCSCGIRTQYQMIVPSDQWNRFKLLAAPTMTYSNSSAWPLLRLEC